MNKRNHILSNFVWRFMERCGAQGVKLVVEIVLARLLLPNDYGLIALVTVIIELLNVFVDSGFANALIQKKNADDLDFSSVFLFNIVLCLCVYIILFLGSPIVAKFYGRSELTLILRVLGIQVIISGVKNVQQAYVSRSLQFKKFFFATLGGTIGAAVIGIVLAYCGFGVWALVAQQIFNTAIDTLVLWIIVKWRPKKMFSVRRLKGLFTYGWKLFVSSLLDTGYSQICQLAIGKIYASDMLAYYNRGQQFPQLFINNVNNAMDSVLLPVMSNVQDHTERVKAMTRRAIKTSTYILAPLMMGLAFAAEQVVELLLTEKWLPCVFYLRIFCITYMFYPVHTANLNAIKAMGRSDMFLKLEIIKKVVGLALLVLTVNISVEAMAYGLLVSSFMCQIINSWPNKKFLHYGYLEQIKDILPSIALAVVMGMLIYCVEYLGWGNLPTLCVQIILGAAIYLAGSIVTRNESFKYLWGIVKALLRK